ncbi:MAG: sigma-54-dependent Fis family transcriptional regulator [Deltaproteobacteria bacterium]|nr:sigma-54-dependent Fis family transcriptional regulator [Deltaproteobacteria bacterium]
MKQPKRNNHWRILAVDDSQSTLEIIDRNLSAADYTVLTANCVTDAITTLERTDVDLVVTDIRMPRISGLDLVRHVRQNHKRAQILVITGYPNVDGAVTALKDGALDYIRKPFTEEELLQAVQRAIDRLCVDRAASGGTPLVHKTGLIGNSRPIERLLTQIDRASKTSATALISGESGTGKELVARAIHYNSPRSAAPFVAVNCGAIPHDLLESELFGHVRGAFTGATEARAGFFLTAEGGTIFLDEIGETSPAMQVKLLRVLQDKEVRMVGASRARTVDIRIIAATNRDLSQLVATGRFREDLFFRLNVLEIRVPPLRERADDISELVAHFVDKFSQELDCPAPHLSDHVLGAFRRYTWPGNVRELENLVQRLVVMADADGVDVADLPAQMRYSLGDAGPDLTRTLAEAEASYIKAVLQSVNGNKTQAAKVLGIDRKTLRAKLEPAKPS